ncbi:tetratricopeptide repeat protein [Burkholderia ambifaria]|uniref:tetratricopeptide repeat protein n=1 Tax=Burkholderia ambifaria TaxID=152480 RepID=UPI001588787A|nr:tetratricopeptide repeat protein [Burkholderia ambifaria]MBY4770962.1 tetratricopeptide repeat protein [Burkholderia ambifaria]
MDDSNDFLIPLIPPLLAMLGQAADAHARGEHDAHALWLAAAGHLHAVDMAALAQLTSALVARQHTADALALAERAVRVHPGADARFNHGYVLQMLGRHAEAVAPYRAAYALDPRWPSLRNNLAIALRLSGGDRNEEIALLDAAVEADPLDVQAWINLVVARLAAQDLDGALACAARLAQIAPDNALALNNIAMAMKEAQRWDDAERYAARACQLAPDDASFRFNLAIIQLVRGNYAAGWRGHEARWDGAGELRGRRPALPGPRWQGEPLAGKTLLVWGEQGLGDVLQFARFVAPLAERVHREGGRLVWNTFPQVGTLMQRSLGAHADAFSAGGSVDELPAFDYEVPLIGLPLMLGMETSTLGESVPYLHADRHARDAWRARLAGDGRLNVGLVWTGSAGHQRNPFRRVGLDRYADAFRGIDGVTFHSLQPGADADVAAARAAGFAIKDYTAELKSFDDTAAFIGALDLVITVCTSVAHLAGALGARTWVLLDVNPHWPWLLERTDSPWYPTATLYRQPTFGAWAPVMAALGRDLRGLAAQAKRPA